MTEQQSKLSDRDCQNLLVEAARSDSPPDDACGRMLASMGISAGVALAASKAAAAGLSGGASATAGKAAGGMGLAKALLLGTVIGVSGTAIAVSVTREPSPAPRGSSPASKTRIAEAPVERIEPSKLPATPLATTEEVSAPPERRAAAAPSSSRFEPVSTQALLERDQLDRARSALLAGRASTAIKSLNEYTERFGFGILGHEATVLRVEALLALGRRDSARDIGERYLAEHPNGAQRAAVRRLLGEATPSPDSDQDPSPRP